MQRVLLAVFGVLLLVGFIVRQQLEERDRKARWREIEHNAALMRRIQTNQGATIETVGKPSAPESESERERSQQEERDREVERLRKMI